MGDSSVLADPERALAIAYAPREARPALAALFRLDEHLGGIVRSTSEPMLGQMRLSWWHEALGALGRGSSPAEPLLVELEALVRQGTLDPSALLPLVEGWEELLEPLPLPDEALAAFARRRGGGLFAAAAQVIAPIAEADVKAGEGWALTDLAFRLSDRDTAERALALAREKLAAPRPWPRRLRALGILATLAAGDARAGLDAPRRPSSPRRVARALWHGVTGR